MKQEVVVLVAVVVTGVALASILQHAMLNVWGNEVMMMSTLFYSKQFHHANTALLHVMCQSLMISLAMIWRMRMRRRRRSQWLLTLVVVLGFFMLLKRVTYGQCGGGITSTNSISYAVVSIPRNAQRLAETLATLSRRGGVDVKVIMGVDGANYSSMNAMFHDQQLPYHDGGAGGVTIKEAALSLSFRKALLQMMHEEVAAEWIVLFEDDASPVPWFQSCLEQHSFPPDVDVVWLDTRETFVWHLLGTLACCTSGIMYRRASIGKMVSWLEPEAERQPFDFALARMCASSSTHRCHFLPLVIESGAASSRE